MPIENTPVMLQSIAAWMGKEVMKKKPIAEFFTELSQATIDWIKPLFLKEDGNPQQELQRLQENPESEIKQNAIIALLQSELEDQPEAEKHIREVFEKINSTEEGQAIAHVIHSKNVNTGDVNTGGGDFILGDNHSR